MTSEHNHELSSDILAEGGRVDWFHTLLLDNRGEGDFGQGRREHGRQGVNQESKWLQSVVKLAGTGSEENSKRV